MFCFVSCFIHITKGIIANRQEKVNAENFCCDFLDFIIGYC